MNKSLLKNYYLHENHSLTQCAKKFGVSRNTIKNYVREFGLYKNSGVGNILYPHLHDAKWLREKYIEEKMSMQNICNYLGCKSTNTVQTALRKNNIPIRNISESNSARFKDNVCIKDINVFNGSMLGDCHLSVTNKNNVRQACIVKNNKFLDHLQYFTSFVVDNSNNIKINPRINRLYYKGEMREYPGFVMRTSASPKLKELYEKWYPTKYNRTKSLPPNLILTPITLLHWFMDDGYSYIPKNKKHIIVQFCSESFTLKENHFLKRQLEILGLKCSIDKTKCGCRIRILSDSTNAFFDLIGECPVESLKYKWKRV